MGEKTPKKAPSDFNADDLIAKSEQHATDIADLSKRVLSLETCQKLTDVAAEFTGTKLYEKVTEAVAKSKDVEAAIKAVVWDMMKSKVGIAMIALGGLILTDLVIRAIPNILKAIGS